MYKIVLFDQRGCGNSTPTACVEDNTTWDLITDMERIRETCRVQRWILFGGSWGSTLSVAYAQTHPDRVIGMILRGIFMNRTCELAWLYERGGAAMLYPEAFEKYLSALPEDLQNANSLMHAFHSVLSRDQPSEERRIAAKAWSTWEHTLSGFLGQGEDHNLASADYSDNDTLAFSRIACHYFANDGFLKEDGFLLSPEQMKKIRHIRTHIVQGRWDVVCPRKSAYDLAKMFDPEKVNVRIVELAGHSTFEPGIEEELLKTTDDFGSEFSMMVGSDTNG